MTPARFAKNHRSSIAGGNSGFTLIELMVVITLMGMMAGLATVLVYRSIERISVTTGAKELASTIRYARQVAITHRKPVRVTIDTVTGNYKIEYATAIQLEPAETGAGGAAQPVPQPVSTDPEMAKTRKLAASTKLLFSADTDLFRPGKPALYTDIDRLEPVDSRIVAVTFTPRGTTAGAVMVFREQDAKGNILPETEPAVLRLDGATGRVDFIPVETI